MLQTHIDTPQKSENFEVDIAHITGPQRSSTPKFDEDCLNETILDGNIAKGRDGENASLNVILPRKLNGKVVEREKIIPPQLPKERDEKLDKLLPQQLQKEVVGKEELSTEVEKFYTNSTKIQQRDAQDKLKILFKAQTVKSYVLQILLVRISIVSPFQHIMTLTVETG